LEMQARTGVIEARVFFKTIPEKRFRPSQGEKSRRVEGSEKAWVLKEGSFLVRKPQSEKGWRGVGLSLGEGGWGPGGIVPKVQKKKGPSATPKECQTLGGEVPEKTKEWVRKHYPSCDARGRPPQRREF